MGTSWHSRVHYTILYYIITYNLLYYIIYIYILLHYIEYLAVGVILGSDVVASLITLGVQREVSVAPDPTA
jgi:Zn-dependent membrane protease YugP